MIDLIAGFVCLAIVAGAGFILWKRLHYREPEVHTLDIPDEQIMSDEQRAARGIRAQMAMNEFLAPALKSLEAEYLMALTTLASNEPWETDKLTKLAVAQRVIKTVEQQIIAAVLDGGVASQELERAKKIAALPEAKRRWVA